MRLCVLMVFFAVNIYAQKVPYAIFPDAEPPYFRVRYNASAKPNELVFPVNYTIWIPPGVKTLKGVIVHQHGCGEGSCSTGLTGAFDLHWQALAKKHECALMAPSYEQPKNGQCRLWCDPRNGSDDSFQKSLEDLGVLSGHTELSYVPWALWGHSGGAAWVGFMTMLHPNRVAAVWLNSGNPIIVANSNQPEVKAIEVPDEVLTIPMMCNLGTQEGVTVKEGKHAKRWEATKQFFYIMRGKGGLIGVAVDPLTGHECGNQRYLAIPWFDACLDVRLSINKDNALRLMPKDEAWYASLKETKAYSGKQFTEDKTKAIWLPNESIAKAWEYYIKDTEIPDNTPPPAPFNLKFTKGVLTWNAEADFESGIAHFSIERDGKEIAIVPDKSGNPLIRPVFQDMRNSDTPIQPLSKMQFIDSHRTIGRNHSYRIFSVNTMGLKSKPSTKIIK